MLFMKMAGMREAMVNSMSTRPLPFTSQGAVSVMFGLIYVIPCTRQDMMLRLKRGVHAGRMGGG